MKNLLKNKVVLSVCAGVMFLGVVGIASAAEIQWDQPKAGYCIVGSGTSQWQGVISTDSEGNRICVQTPALSNDAIVRVLASFGGGTTVTTSKNVWNYFNSVFPQSTKS